MAGNVYLWSTTSATNSAADGDINWVEGQLPSTVNDSARGMMAGVAGWLKDTNSTLTTGGSANVQSVTSNVAYAALATGIRLHIKAGFTNTAACTLNLTPAGGGAFGAKAIKIVTTAGEVDPAANNIRANGHYILEYDAAANAAVGAWILLNPSIALVVAVQTFTASGTYTPRAGIVHAMIECVGGGGGGGCASSTGTLIVGAGGGGSGGYSRTRVTASAIGASQTVTIGAAGAAPTSPGNAGGGGETSVGTLCIAKGGGGGLGSIAGANIGTGGAGGIPGTGDVAASGNSGDNGGYCSTTITFSPGGGMGGASCFGGAGLAPTTIFGNSAAGNSASNYGSGGSGSVSHGGSAFSFGSTGSAGVVIITEFSAA